MPELPEVETVKETLKKQILNKTIKNVNVLCTKMIEFPDLDEFKKKIVGQTFIDIKRRGKWLMFELNDYYLLSHLRMEGRYYIKNLLDIIEKHEYVIFDLDDVSLRYKDTRKFGKMLLINKNEVYDREPISLLGLEPWDEKLTIDYLKFKLKNKNTSIKTLLLDQTIIVGIGNIYADEILFLSKINPEKKSKQLSDTDLSNIINNTKEVLLKAIKKGGTTIKSYESSLGVHGNFQSELLVHNKENEKCVNCQTIIKKIVVNGRGTYYCPKCQK